MKALESLGKDSLWLLAARLIGQGLSAVFVILVARSLGRQGFGEYAFIAACILTANTFSTFGTDMLLIRSIAADGDYSGLPGAQFIQLGLSALLILVAWLAGPLIPNQSLQAIHALQIYSLALIPQAVFSIFTAALRGAGRLDLYGLLNLTLPALQLGLLLPVRGGLDLLSLAALLLLVQALAALVAGMSCVLALPAFPRRWRISRTSVVWVWKAAAPLALLGMLGVLYQKLGLILLAIMAGAAETGAFSAAARILEASKAVHLAAFTAMYPALSQVHGGLSERPELAGALLGFWKGLLFGALAGAVLLFVLAEPLTNLLYGSAFSTSAGPLRILAWSLIPFTINAFLGLALLAARREFLLGRALGAGLLSLGLLSLWLIPAQGAQGEAKAFLAAESIQSAVLLAHWGKIRLGLEGDMHGLPDLP